MSLLETILALDGPYVVHLHGPEFYEVWRFATVYKAVKQTPNQFEFGTVKIALVHEADKASSPYWFDYEIDAALEVLG